MRVPLAIFSMEGGNKFGISKLGGDVPIVDDESCNLFYKDAKGSISTVLIL